jgi:hypothetical protein
LILVILGAGASHGSRPKAGNPLFDAERWDEGARPPLTAGLFDSRPRFRSIQDEYPSAAPVIELLKREIEKKADLEQVLSDLTDESQSSDRMRIALRALRIYLWRVIRDVGEEWGGSGTTSNVYDLLLLELDRLMRFGEEVAFVTFNYDTLLEEAMRRTLGWRPWSIDSYVDRSGPVQVFRPHGSVAWGSPLDLKESMKATDDSESREEWVWEYILREMPDEAIGNEPERLLIDGSLDGVARRLPDNNQGRDRYLPAITLPINKKSDFTFPSSHRQALEARIPDVTSVLIVGWRANEDHFMDLVQRAWVEKANPVPITVANACVDSRQSVFRRFESLAVQDDWGWSTIEDRTPEDLSLVTLLDDTALFQRWLLTF